MVNMEAQARGKWRRPDGRGARYEVAGGRAWIASRVVRDPGNEVTVPGLSRWLPRHRDHPDRAPWERSALWYEGNVWSLEHRVTGWVWIGRAGSRSGGVMGVTVESVIPPLAGHCGSQSEPEPVSYTHLTLPTSARV